MVISTQVWYLQARLEPTREELITVLQSNGSLALPANISLGWKRMEKSNSLAYYDTTTITIVKNFTI
jgi:hypothetical protein